MDAIAFTFAVLTLKAKWNFSVTSWGRTTKHNEDVGGVPDSYHLLWMAIDIIFDTPLKKNLQFEKDARLAGLLAIFEGDCYHLQPLQ